MSVNIIHVGVLIALWGWKVSFYEKVGGGYTNWTSRDAQTGFHGNDFDWKWNDSSNNRLSDSRDLLKENDDHNLTAAVNLQRQLKKSPSQSTWDTNESGNPENVKKRNGPTDENSNEKLYTYRKTLPTETFDKEKTKNGNFDKKNDATAQELKEVQGLKPSFFDKGTVGDEERKKGQREYERGRGGGEGRRTEGKRGGGGGGGRKGERKEGHNQNENENEQKMKDEQHPRQKEEGTGEEEEKEREKNEEVIEEKTTEEERKERRKQQQQEEDNEEIVQANDSFRGTSGKVVDKNSTRNKNERVHAERGQNKRKSLPNFPEGDDLGVMLEVGSGRGRRERPLDFSTRWKRISNTSARNNRLKRVRRQTIANGPALVYRQPLKPHGQCLCVLCSNADGQVKDQEKIENAAFNKPAVVSSKNELGGTSLGGCGAVNGNTDRAWSTKNCLITKQNSDDPNAWWMVDLQFVYTFKKMTLFREASSVNEGGIMQTSIYVDLLLCKELPAFQDKDGKNKMKRSDKYTLECGSVMTGRTVLFRKRNLTPADKWIISFLSFCELQIWVCKKGTHGPENSGCRPCPDACKYTCDSWHGCNDPILHNIAIVKPATDSLQISQSDPKATTDGFIWKTEECFIHARPNSEQVMWIRVDFLSTYKVFSYVLYAFNGHPELTMKEFYAVVSEEPDPSPGGQWPPPGDLQCHYYPQPYPDKANQTINCTSPKIGRYFFLARKGTEGLKFCELAVLGHHRYGLNTGSACYSGSETAVCIQGSICQNGVCGGQVPNPCEADNQCIFGAQCDNGLCKYSFDSGCSVEKHDCAAGLTCDRGTHKCKQHVNTQCSSNDACLSTDMCDSLLSKCKRKREGACTNHEDCAAGAVCDENSRKCTCNGQCSCSDADNDKCKPKTSKIGSSCSGNDDCEKKVCSNNKCACPTGQSIYAQEFSCKLSADSPCSDDSDCNTGLKCQAGTCKIEAGQSCLGNENSCLDGLTCENDVCKIPVGAACQEDEHLCVRGSRCSHGTCKLMLNEDCENNRQHCMNGTCSSEQAGFRCKLTEGQRCSPNSAGNQTQCRSGTHCDAKDKVCKLDLGQPCHDSTLCQSGTVCSAKPPSTDKKCRYPLGFVGCQDDEECDGGYVCDSQNHCMLAKGADCQGRPKFCLAGSTCSEGRTCTCSPGVTVPASDKCTPQAGVVSGECLQNLNATCEDDHASCVDNKCQCHDRYTINRQTLSCGISAGSSCAGQGSVCSLETSCFAGICLLNPGEPCGGSRRGLCAMAAVCDVDGFCRLKLHQNCSGQPSNCMNGTVCDALKRCKTRPLGYCRKDDQCMAGSHCEDNTCRCTRKVSVLSNNICELKSGIVGSSGCAPGDKCQDQNARCEDQRCVCLHGLVPEARQLNCTKKAGEGCSDDSECATGMVCDPQDKKCKIQLEQLCDGEKKNCCITGAICDVDSKCRLNLKGNCSGDRYTSCKINTYCDRLGQCSHGAGEPCKLTDSCMAGAECVNSKCVCNPDFATKLGVDCVPNPGKLGGSCELTSCGKNSECKENFCVCKHGATPNRQFDCGLKKLKVSSLLSIGVLGIILGSILGLGLLATLVFAYRQAHKMKERQEILARGRANIKEITELRSRALSLTPDACSHVSGLSEQLTSTTEEMSSTATELSSAATDLTSTAGTDLTSTSAVQYN